MPRILAALSLVLLTALGANAGEKPAATMFKRPFCGCCDGHADHLRANGYKVTVIQSRNMTSIKGKHKVPLQLEGCHTLLIGGYVVEGHVPAHVIDKLLKGRPAIRGISVPGMPAGSPGMSGVKRGPLEIYEISDGPAKVYATH